MHTYQLMALLSPLFSSDRKKIYTHTHKLAESIIFVILFGAVHGIDISCINRNCTDMPSTGSMICVKCNLNNRCIHFLNNKVLRFFSFRHSRAYSSDVVMGLYGYSCINLHQFIFSFAPLVFGRYAARLK